MGGGWGNLRPMDYGPSSPGAFTGERSRASRSPRFSDAPESFEDDRDDGADGGGGGAVLPAIDVSEIKGVARARDRLLPWFRKIVDSVEEEQNPLRVTLAQRTAHAGTQKVTTLEHDLQTPVDDTINELLQLAAEDLCEANFIGTKITYALIVPLSNGSNSVQNFVLEQPSLQGALHEPPQRQHFPDAPGVIGQFMGQNLQLTQFALEAASSGKETLERTIERLEEENRYLKRTQFARDREMQILLDGNLKRQFMVEEHRAKVDRDTKIGEGFKAVMPQLLPLLLPQGMAQALAGPLAMAQAAANPPMQQDMHGEGHPQDEGPQGGGFTMPGSGPGPGPGGNEIAIIDELIREFEEDQVFLVKLFNVMGEKPRCAQLLAMLYESSRARQQARAQHKPEESRRTPSK